MSVPAAYLGVILIWATTPLTIKWSGEGPGFLFGVAGRMAVGALLAIAVAHLMRVKVWRSSALAAYMAAGLGIFGAMLCTYWAAQFIPSGWISVVFGLTPVLTGVVASFCLGKGGITPLRLIGMALGLAGLAVIFVRGHAVDPTVLYGVAGVVVAVLIHSTSAVCVKRMSTGVPALAMVTGGLSVAAPLFAVTWALFDGAWPGELPVRSAGSILYLAVIGSVVGFALYFYVLSRVDATKVALITLITPIAALLLGHFMNGEALTASVWLGAGLVLVGLAVFEFGERWLRALIRREQVPG